MPELATGLRTRVLDGFDDPTFGPDDWDALLASTNSDNVYLTWQWQRAWWETTHRGTLLLIAAERDGEVIALAPFYAQSGMVCFVSSEFESDYLDFIGDLSAPDVLDALLETARQNTPDFLGFQFYFVPDASGSGARLREAAARLALSCYEEDDMAAPILELEGQRDQALALANKKRLIDRERFFLKNGTLRVQHLRDGGTVLAHLPEFFAQHTARWDGTTNPSRFVNEAPRLLFERFTRLAADSGWLRFTRIEWNGRPIAFHYGLCYRGRYFWGPTSFDPALARYSPGQVLLRLLLLEAIEEGARVFDFGTGDADFKLQFASRVNRVRTWELYPSRSAAARLESEAVGVVAAQTE